MKPISDSWTDSRPQGETVYNIGTCLACQSQICHLERWTWANVEQTERYCELCSGSDNIEWRDEE